MQLRTLLEIRKDMFYQKFGRDPKPGEPLFFDADAPEPKRLSQRQLDHELEKVL